MRGGELVIRMRRREVAPDIKEKSLFRIPRLYRCALSMGLRAHLEPKYLDPQSGLQPTCHLLFILPLCQAGASSRTSPSVTPL